MVTDTLIVFDNIRHTIKVVASAHSNEGRAASRAYAEATAKIRMIALLQEPIKPLLLESEKTSISSPT